MFSQVCYTKSRSVKSFSFEPFHHYLSSGVLTQIPLSLSLSTQNLALFGALLFFLGMKNSIPRRHSKRRAAKAKTTWSQPRDCSRRGSYQYGNSSCFTHTFGAVHVPLFAHRIRELGTRRIRYVGVLSRLAQFCSSVLSRWVLCLGTVVSCFATENCLSPFRIKGYILGCRWFRACSFRSLNAEMFFLLAGKMQRYSVF